MAIYIDNTANKVYLAGSFTSFTNNSGIVSTINYLCRLNMDGNIDTTFVPVGAGFNGSVTSLAVDTSFIPSAAGFDAGVSSLALDSATGDLYVGGNFNSFTNVSSTMNSYSGVVISVGLGVLDMSGSLAP